MFDSSGFVHELIQDALCDYAAEDDARSIQAEDLDSDDLSDVEEPSALAASPKPTESTPSPDELATLAQLAQSPAKERITRFLISLARSSGIEVPAELEQALEASSSSQARGSAEHDLAPSSSLAARGSASASSTASQLGAVESLLEEAAVLDSILEEEGEDEVEEQQELQETPLEPPATFSPPANHSSTSAHGPSQPPCLLEALSRGGGPVKQELEPRKEVLAPTLLAAPVQHRVAPAAQAIRLPAFPPRRVGTPMLLQSGGFVAGTWSTLPLPQQQVLVPPVRYVQVHPVYTVPMVPRYVTWSVPHVLPGQQVPRPVPLSTYPSLYTLQPRLQR